MQRFAFGFVFLSLILPGLACAQEASDSGIAPALQAESCQPQPLCAPERVQDQTLFASGIYSHGGFVGPAVKITNIDGHNEVMAGGELAWLVNHQFILGLAGYGQTTDGVKRMVNGANRTLYMGYGGLEIGYIFFPHSLVHFTFQTLVGAGGVGYTWETDTNSDSDADHDQRHWDSNGSGFFVAEPELLLELNVTRWFRLCLGGGYRYVDGVDENRTGINSTALRGASGKLLLKFGIF